MPIGGPGKTASSIEPAVMPVRNPTQPNKEAPAEALAPALIAPTLS